MVEKISVGIELEGADDVRKTLDEIVGGIDGLKSAAEELGQTDATVEVKAEGADEAKDKIAEVKGAAEELGQTDATVNVGAEGAAEAKGLLDPLSDTATILSTRFDMLGDAVTKMGARMTRALGPLGVVARSLGPVGIGLGVAAAAFIKFGNDAAKAISEVSTTSAKLGLTFQQTDKLRAGFEQAGISSEAMTAGLEKLKAAGLNAATAFPEILAQLQAMPDSVDRTNTAIALLGDKLGIAVVGALRTGSLSFAQFNSALGTFTQQQQIAADSFEQSMNRMSGAFDRFKASAVMPVLTPAFDAATASVDRLSSTLKTLDWSAVGLGARFGLSPVATVIELIRAQFRGLGPAAAQAGQTGAQGAQQATIAFTAWGEAIKVVNGQGQTAAQTAAQAGQTGAQGAQQATIAFTAWGEAIKMVNGQGQTAAQTAAQAGQTGAQGAQQGQTAFDAYGQAIKNTTGATDQYQSSLVGVDWTAPRQGVSAWDALSSAIQSAYDWVVKYINKALEASGIKPSAPVTGGSAPGKARGGLLGGRGSGTSDSNLAWLSRGEYVMPAHAVRRPGVLAFLEALRSGRIPGFAEGGAVGAGGGGENVLQQLGQALVQIDTNVRGVGQEVAALESFIGATNEDCKKESEKTRQKIDDETPADTFWEALLSASKTAATGIIKMEERLGALGPFAAGGLLGGRGTGTSDSNLAWLSRGEHIMPARVVRQPGVLSLLEALRRGGNLPGFAGGGLIPGYAKGGRPADVVISGSFAGPIDGWIRTLDKALVGITSALAQLATAMQDVLATHRQNLAQPWDDIADVMVKLGELSQRVASGAARGGIIGGRGTGTSDSNLAWVSRGEYVTPARAVRQPGVLMFLEALRRSGGNLSRVLDGMGRFALGGMVPRPAMAFAAGGLAGGNNITIQFPGLPEISGLRASSGAVDELRKAAALAQVRSGGRKPSRYS